MVIEYLTIVPVDFLSSPRMSSKFPRLSAVSERLEENISDVEGSWLDVTVIPYWREQRYSYCGVC